MFQKNYYSAQNKKKEMDWTYISGGRYKKYCHNLGVVLLLDGVWVG
jgi:hypothetical protein